MASPNLDLRDHIPSPSDELVFKALGMPFAQAAATSTTGFALVRNDATIIWANAAFTGLACLRGSPVGVQLDQALDVRFRLPKGEALAALTGLEAGTLELHSARSPLVLLHIAGLDGDRRIVVAASSTGEHGGAVTAPGEHTHVDPLTKLGSKRELQNQLDRWHGDTGLVLLRIDLDRFSDINDSLGRMQGDRLLQLVADRLKRISRAGDAVFHTSGDEFVILQPVNAPSIKSASTIAERMTAVFDRPFRLEDRLIDIGASVGVAFVEAGDMGGAKDLLWKTEAMVRETKRASGQSWRVFDGDSL